MDSYLTMLDPELRLTVARMPKSDYSSPAAKRAGSAGRTPVPSEGNEAGIAWSDRKVGRKPVDQVPVRIYYPPESDGAVDGTRGCYVHFHGGGFISGDETIAHHRAMVYAAAARCTVVSVGYRLAPEHPYPAALEDGAEVIRWIRDRQYDDGGAGPAIGIGGDSAGGGIAAGLALQMRDHGEPALRFQLLLYPALDDRRITTSVAQFWDALVLAGADLTAMWSYYLAGQNGSEVPQYAAPARAKDLTGLPLTYLLACEGDPLRDEGLDYAQRLLAAGVGTEIHCVARTCHAFDAIAPTTEIGNRALNEQAQFIRRAFAEASV
jgi:acetyl esterase/lipase